MAERGNRVREARAAGGGVRGASVRAARRQPGALGGYGITTAGLADLRRKYPANTPLGEPIGTVAGSILDYVSRPAFMVADIVQGDVSSFGKNALNLLAPGTQAIEPLAGSRETVSQALEQRGVNFGGGIPGFIGRFATDVVTDPLTYLSLGTASGLKGAGVIARTATERAIASGASSPRSIARAMDAGLITPEQAKVFRAEWASRAQPELENATKQYLAERGGQGVVAGFRMPTTIARTAGRITGKKVKTVYPLVESKTLARGLEKVGANMSGVRGIPVLRSVFTAAGGEDMGAYQSFLGAMNVVNQHKAEFARDSRNIERVIEKTGSAAGIKRVDASPIVSHLYDAPAVAERATAIRADLAAQMGRTADDAERLALQQQIDALPTDTRSAYEWLSANHNHGTRFRFAAFDDAVRAFGNPDDIADDSILGIVRTQARKYEDYADTAGVLYEKLDQPYLTHLGADQRSKDALEKFDEATQVSRGSRRKMQEGFTRHRYLPTLMDWYLAEAAQGIKLVPELSVGRRLTVRGVSGASEAMHAVLMREFVKMYGARGPLPDMDELEDLLAQAVRQAEQQDQRLAKMLNRSNSPMAKQARSDYARLRRELVAARKALADAKKTAGLGSGNVADTEVVKTAQKAVDDIQAQIEEVKNRPRAQGAIPVDLSAKQSEQIAEATRNLESARIDRVQSTLDMGQRITRAAVEKVRDVKARFAADPDEGPGVFDTPEAEAQAIKNEEINQARQEVARLEALVEGVVREVARWMSKTTKAGNAAARDKARGGGDLRAPLGKKKKQLAREVKKPNPNPERIAELEADIARLEKTIAEFGSGDDIRSYAQGKTKQQREEAPGPQSTSAASGRGSGSGTDSRTIAQRYEDAMEYILEFDTFPEGLLPPTKGSKRGPITQDEWDDAKEQIVELVASRQVLDDLEAEAGPSQEFLDYQARAEAELDALGGGVETTPVGYLADDAIAREQASALQYEPLDQGAFDEAVAFAESRDIKNDIDYRREVPPSLKEQKGLRETARRITEDPRASLVIRTYRDDRSLIYAGLDAYRADISVFPARGTADDVRAWAQEVVNARNAAVDSLRQAASKYAEAVAAGKSGKSAAELEKARIAVRAGYIENIDKRLIAELDKFAPGLIRIGEPDAASAGIRDAMNAEVGGGMRNRLANDELYSDATIGDLAGAPAQNVFRPVDIPEGESIAVSAQPSDIMERAATDQLPWSQRQVVKLLRKRFGSPANMDRPWVSVKSGRQGFSVRVGNKNAAISQDELLQMEQAGWIVVDIPNAKGEITRIKPGPQLQAEGLPLGEVEGTIRQNLETVMRDAGAEPVRAAKAAVERARTPIGPEAQKVAELDAALKTAIEQGRTDKLAEREIGRLKARQVEARARLAEARRRGQQDLIAKEQQRVDDLVEAQAALKEFIRALKTPPNARKVAAATRKRDDAGKKAQRIENAVTRIRFADEAAKAYIRALYKAEASYEEAVMATGYVKNAEDWLVVQESWVAFTDRYIPRKSTLDPNAGTLFDPAIAPQIKRVLDRMNPEIRSQSGLRKIGRFIRGLTRAWKSLVLATPGYHIRNMIDDGLRAYWAGARDPTSFYQAVRILQGKADNIKIRGQVYSREEILSMANAHGIVGTGSQYHSEVGPAYERQVGRRRIAGIPLPRKPGSGAIVITSQMIGEMRENMTRLGTFIELLKNGEDELIAGKNVRDFLFDYNDVSPFIIAAKDFWSPFITYTLKAVPFYAKTLVQRPGQLANLSMFMRDMTATAAYDYPGEVTMEYMAPGQELSFALPRIPGISDALFGEGKPGAVDPSNLIGISAINQVSPISFPQPGEGENAVGAALGTIPRGLARTGAGLINPLVRYGIETGTQQDMRFGSPLPNRTRLTPIPLAAQQILSAASGGNLSLPGYGMKTDAYSGEQVEGASTNLLRLLNLFPPLTQAGSYATVTGGFGFDNPFVNESDAGRISFVRTFSGIPVRPLDVSRAQYFATRRQ